ncbi:MAG: hypothetical protein JXB18_09135 [Sedimentisphaerales bacterium]|nr:hypothetical protein [Sedimentisphaerales bacterium]
MSDDQNMNNYSLSKAQLVELENQRRKLRDKRQADHVKVVIAHIYQQYRVRYSLRGLSPKMLISSRLMMTDSLTTFCGQETSGTYFK